MREKTGDVNWIMMVQQPSDGRSVTMETTKSGDVLGFWVLAKTHTSLKMAVLMIQSATHAKCQQSQISYIPIPTLQHHPIQQSAVDLAH